MTKTNRFQDLCIKNELFVQNLKESEAIMAEKINAKDESRSPRKHLTYHSRKSTNKTRRLN